MFKTTVWGGGKNFITFRNLYISSFLFCFFVCLFFVFFFGAVALGVLGFLVFLLNYCLGGGFKNLKLFRKDSKLFAVFADNLDIVIYSIWVYSKYLHLKHRV